MKYIFFCFCFSGSFFKNLGRKKSDEPEKKKDSPEKKKVRFFGRNKSDPKEPEDEVKDPEAETNGKETTAESETEKEDSASEDEESETDKDENDDDVSQTDFSNYFFCYFKNILSAIIFKNLSRLLIKKKTCPFFGTR